MEIKPGFFDGLTSIDELLKENTHVLRELRSLLEREEVRETRAVYFAYPDDGTLTTLQAGTTIFNFATGTIEDVDHNFTNMNHSLQSEGRDWLRSFFVNSDKNISVQPDSYDKIPATEEKDALGIYQEFTKLQITCVEETKVFIACCTSPEAVVRLISNTSVLADPLDVFGHRTYIGAGELAARLGSINTYERRGNVVFIDDFEDSTLKWKVGGSGTDHTEVRTNNSAHSKNYSMKLTTGNAALDGAYIQHLHYVPPLKRLGIEMAVALEVATPGQIWNEAMIYDGSYYIHPQALYYPSSGSLKITDENDVAQTIATVSTKRDPLFYNQWKMVFDLNTYKYVRMFFNNVEYDISDYGIYRVLNSSAAHMYIQILAYNASSGNHSAYIDNVILTQNEPI